MNKKYTIIADENMPGVDELFSGIANIIYADGRNITHSLLKRADALLCRSITNVDAALLKNTSVKFVGTATIGIDHLDTQWLTEQGISWSNAAGCNAPAVGQYVLSAIAFWCLQSRQSLPRSRKIRDLTVGIVGAGNVGTTLANYLDYYRINYKLCDPPLKDKGDSREMVCFNEVLKCDVITLHVPLTTLGLHKTHHLLTKENLQELTSEQLLINASRGGVINNQALAQYLPLENSANCIIDTFENEPNINESLVKHCLLATPHIAGHTLEGKLRGSWMVYKAFCKEFNLPCIKKEAELYPPNNKIEFFAPTLEENLLNIYDIASDSDALKRLPTERVSTEFDGLRKVATKLSNGCIRRDYTGWTNLNDVLSFSLPS